MTRKQWDPALADLTRAIELDPKTAWRYGLRSEASRAKGDLDGALQDLTRALELDPSEVLGYAQRASIHFQREEYDLALGDYSKILELDPDNLTALRNRAAAHFRRGDFEDAVRDYSEAIDRAPDNVTAYGFRAYTYERSGQLAAAIADYEKAVELDGTSHSIVDRLARILATRPDESVRDGKRAVEFATRACEMTGWKQAVYLDTLAAAYAEAGEFETACEQIERAIPLAPDSTAEAEFRERLSLYRSGKPYREDGL